MGESFPHCFGDRLDPDGFVGGVGAGLAVELAYIFAAGMMQADYLPFRRPIEYEATGVAWLRRSAIVDEASLRLARRTVLFSVRCPENRCDQVPGGRFQPGKSGNPGGRPKEVGRVKELARVHTDEALTTLAAIMRDEKSPAAARVRAAECLLDRGLGSADAAACGRRRGTANRHRDIAGRASSSSSGRDRRGVSRASARGVTERNGSTGMPKHSPR
jgi:hypothetical protein